MTNMRAQNPIPTLQRHTCASEKIKLPVKGSYARTLK